MTTLHLTDIVCVVYIKLTEESVQYMSRNSEVNASSVLDGFSKHFQIIIIIY